MTDTKIYSDNLRQCAKFLYRGSFGPKKGQIDLLQKKGFDAWFDDQFSATPTYQLSKLRSLLSSSSYRNAQDDMRQGIWWQCTITGEDQLRQRMAYALSQLFVVSSHGVGSVNEGLANYYDMLVKHAFDNFRTLFKTVTISAMMGQYLTLSGSKKHNPQTNTFPDENFPRECMQLFTIGLWQLDKYGQPILDQNGNKIPTYNQDDVENMSRLLCGWNIHYDNWRYDWISPMTADNSQHDMGEKTVMGTHFPAGQDANQDLDAVVDMLFNHSNTPVFIAIHLIKRFVTSNPSRNYIRRVAEVFEDNGDGIRGDLQATIKAVLTDPDVFKGISYAAEHDPKDEHQHFGLLKEPLLVVANQLRALNMQAVGEHWWDTQWAEVTYGQAALCAETVFNFYKPNDAPQGEITDLGLAAPEFTIITADIMRKTHNRMWYNTLKWNKTDTKEWHWDRTDFHDLSMGTTEYVALINERFYGGLMSQSLQDYMYKALSLHTAPYQLKIRFINAIYIATTAPEFFCEG
ncbi:DUF1800 family protein [Photobacterium phosphoreum]|uniref:DUF1800 family protein n=1 Tax=Photobacterium phosphoreum TaxID=659 RepID=A0AAW4ZXD5_PHOPO|nr:DUF1800 family protein [Photobacterium phosphoreum]MCD9490950.1 DUF1800 family protein [Photobacterium phosphoreum]MCF2190216.1 DUF1800 family protein [Photobacterium phosphoreum]MCF2301998.1 DUF1800 family protein [Photobacterium phosphoreum]